MTKRVIIEDFVEDLNYELILLDITQVDKEVLRSRLKKDYLNKLWRLDDAEFLYVENCDYQGEEIERTEDCCYKLKDYIDKDGFSLYLLQYDESTSEFYYEVEVEGEN